MSVSRFAPARSTHCYIRPAWKSGNDSCTLYRARCAGNYLCAGRRGQASKQDRHRRALGEFGIPEHLLGVGSLALPVMELVVAGLLVPASTARIGAALGALLLAAFSAAIGMALSQGKQPNCNCFGRLTRSPVSARTIARDLVLAALAAHCCRRPGKQPCERGHDEGNRNRRSGTCSGPGARAGQGVVVTTPTAAQIEAVHRILYEPARLTSDSGRHK